MDICRANPESCAKMPAEFKQATDIKTPKKKVTPPPRAAGRLALAAARPRPARALAGARRPYAAPAPVEGRRGALAPRGEGA